MPIEDAVITTGSWIEKILYRKNHTPLWMTGQLSRKFWILRSSNSTSEKRMDFHTPCWLLRRVSRICSFLPSFKEDKGQSQKERWKHPQVSPHTGQQLGSLLERLHTTVILQLLKKGWSWTVLFEWSQESLRYVLVLRKTLISVSVL